MPPPCSLAGTLHGKLITAIVAGPSDFKHFPWRQLDAERYHHDIAGCGIPGMIGANLPLYGIGVVAFQGAAPYGKQGCTPDRHVAFTHLVNIPGT